MVFSFIFREVVQVPVNVTSGPYSFPKCGVFKHSSVRYPSLTAHMHIKELVMRVYNGKVYDAEKLFVIEISASTVWWANNRDLFPIH
jgi:hypothetical protein